MAVAIEVHAMLVRPLIGGIREHADVRLRAAIGEMIAGVENMPEKRLSVGGGGFSHFSHAGQYSFLSGTKARPSESKLS